MREETDDHDLTERGRSKKTSGQEKTIVHIGIQKCIRRRRLVVYNNVLYLDMHCEQEALAWPDSAGVWLVTFGRREFKSLAEGRQLMTHSQPFVSTTIGLRQVCAKPVRKLEETAEKTWLLYSFHPCYNSKRPIPPLLRGVSASEHHLRWTGLSKAQQAAQKHLASAGWNVAGARQSPSHDQLKKLDQVSVRLRHCFCRPGATCCHQ